MRKDKEKIIKLRKSGKSYQEIFKITGVPKSTLSTWLSGQDWSKEVALKNIKIATETNKVRICNLNKLRGKKLDMAYFRAKEEALDDLNNLKYHPLFIAGVMIYWGEGDKASKNGFRIANSDPVMIRLFVDFLIKICNVPKNRIRASLLIYPDHNASEIEELWLNRAKLHDIKFTRTHKVLGRKNGKRKGNGVCTISFSNTYLKKKMKVWIDRLPEVMMNDLYYKENKRA